MSYIPITKENIKRFHTKVYRIIGDKVEVGRITRDGRFTKDLGGEIKADLSELFYKETEERLWDIVLNSEKDVDLEEVVSYKNTKKEYYSFYGTRCSRLVENPSTRSVEWICDGENFKNKEELIKIIKNEK